MWVGQLSVEVEANHVIRGNHMISLITSSTMDPSNLLITGHYLDQ
jgi:hypothetical protein